MSQGIGVVSRLRNLWRGFLSLWVEGLESEHPEAVYEAAIQTRTQQYADLKKAVSGLIYLRNKLSTDLEKKSKELEDVNAQIPIAVNSGEDEVAIILIEKKDKLIGEISELKKELAKAENQSEEAKANLIQFQGEINKLKQEKDSMLAKKANAEAKLKIQQTLEGLSMDADIKALDGVRESIHKLSAEADISTEIADQGLEGKLKKIRQQTSSSSARAQLEALKQAQAASSIEMQAKKTL